MVIPEKAVPATGTTLRIARPVPVDSRQNGMHVCMVITYSKGKDQSGKVANPARGQLNRGNYFFLVCVRA